jgi:sensor histidine kinase YesM
MTPIGLLLLSLPVIFLLRYWMERSGAGRGIRLRTFFLNHVFYTLISLVFGVSFYFIRWSRYKELQQKDLEIQNRKSELSFLRSQINPHFLFNSLNNIYSLVYQGSGQALTAIAGLSELLRYMLYDAAEKVPLATEMAYIQKYIGLQQLRFEHPVEVDLKMEGNMDGIVIPPLLLIPFIENAFKHGDLSKGGLSIYLQSSSQKTYFHCTNRKGLQQKDPGGGIGLENVKRRLSLLYPDKHVFLIEEGPINFSINLELQHD